MANKQNLRPIKLTHEEATDFGRKGGKASGKARRKKKTFQTVMKYLLDMKMPDEFQKKVKEHFPELAEEILDFRDGMSLRQIHKAVEHGDLASFVAVRDTAGEMPIKKVDMNANVTGIDFCFLENDNDEKLDTDDDNDKIKVND